MYFSLAFGFLLLGIIMFVGYFAVLFLSNRSYKGESKNHLRNSYAYLYYMNASLATRVLLYALLVSGVLFIGLGEAFFFSSNQFSFFQVFLAIFFPLSIFLLALSNILSLNYYKAKLLCSLSSFLCYSFSCIAFGMVPFINGLTLDKEFYSMPIAIIVCIIGVITFLSLFNPKLVNWAKMQKVEEDGKTYYVKPKWNFLAFYEWIYLILMVVTAFLFFLNLGLRTDFVF